MTEFWKFANQNPGPVIGFVFFSFFIGSLVVYFLIQQIIRAFTIRKAGYPPPHCDVEGEPVRKDSDDD